MDEQKIIKEITDIEKEISLLPEGSISKKKIKNKDYYYHRIIKDGKRVEN